MPRFCRERVRELFSVVADHVVAALSVAVLVFVVLALLVVGYYAGPLWGVVFGPLAGKAWCYVFGARVAEVIEYWTVTPEVRRWAARVGRGL